MRSSSTETPVKRIQLRCKDCNGIMTVDENKSVLSCPYCGSKEILLDADAVAVERIKGQTQLDLEDKRQAHELKVAAEQEHKERVNSFKKSKSSKLLILAVLITFVVGISKFQSHQIMLAIIAFAQSALFLVSWMLGMQIIREKKAHFYILPAILGIALIFLFFNTSSRINEAAREEARLAREAARIAEENTPYSWPDSGLALQLPVPGSETGKIITNTSDQFIMSVYHLSDTQYDDYVQACEAKGFLIDPETSSGYEAYNSEGYFLELSYTADSDTLHISLDAPRKLSTLKWPKGDLVAQLPPLESTVGAIIQDNSDSFSAYIGDTSLDDFNNYVDACWDAGFTQDYSRYSKSFSALNAKGYYLQLKYKGFNTVYLFIVAPEEDYSDSVEDPAPTEDKDPSSVTSVQKETAAVSDDDAPRADEKAASNKNTGSPVSSDLKKTLDSYEAFIDSYISFLKSYDSSNLTMMTKYISMMAKYEDFLEKLEAIDENSLSAADAAYYLEVTARVQAKLASVAALP